MSYLFTLIAGAIARWPARTYIPCNANPRSYSNRLRYALHEYRKTSPVPDGMVVGIKDSQVFLGPRADAPNVPLATESALAREIVSPPSYVFDALCWLHEHHYLTSPTTVSLIGVGYDPADIAATHDVAVKHLDSDRIQLI